MTWNAVLVGGPRDGEHRVINADNAATAIVYRSLDLADGVERPIYYDPTAEFDSKGYQRYRYRKPELENA